MTTTKPRSAPTRIRLFNKPTRGSRSPGWTRVQLIVLFCVASRIIRHAQTEEEESDSGTHRQLLGGSAADCSSLPKIFGLFKVFPDSVSLDYAMLGAYIPLAFLFFFGIAVICDDYFMTSLEQISTSLKLSDDVAGATFMAAGSSAPELCTSVMDTFIYKNNIGIGTIVGSAVFNILMIIAAAAAFASEPLVIEWKPFTRDCIFYLASVFLLVPMIRSGDSFSWYEGLILILMYGLYVLSMKYNASVMFFLSQCETADERKAQKVSSMRNSMEVALDEMETQTEEEMAASIAFVNQVFEVKHPKPADTEDPDLPRMTVGRAASLLLNGTIVFCTGLWYMIFAATVPDCSRGRWKGYKWTTFSMSVFWIAILSLFLVDFTTRIGCVLDIPAVVMGSTFLAAGTSVPDALSSIIAAKEGKGDMAVSNAIGSNVFDVCLGLGIPYFIMCAFIEPGSKIPILDAGNIGSQIGILLGTLFIVVMMFTKTGFVLYPKVGNIMVCLYLCFVTYLLVDEYCLNQKKC